MKESYNFEAYVNREKELLNEAKNSVKLTPEELDKLEKKAQQVMKGLILNMALIEVLVLNNEVYNKPNCFQRFFNYISRCCRCMLCCCCKRRNRLPIDLINLTQTSNDRFDTSFIGQLYEKLLNKDTDSVPKLDEQKTDPDQYTRRKRRKRKQH